MDHVLESERKGEITPENVIHIVENINVAAIETTLWSIEWALAELVNHPTVQQKINTLLPQDDEPLTESNVHALRYLNAAVKETLRLHSPIPLLVPHMNLEPARSPRAPRWWSTLWLGNDPALWDRPERFLLGGQEEKVDATTTGGGGKVDFRFVPFGVGRRSCPGIALVVGKLVRRFEMAPPPGVEKVDVSDKGGQFSLHIANHSVIAFRPVSDSA
ncbi:hypothetical protein QOZ80_2AG0130480 [Eleusine coracana subsp. coracana]|nr:hypothetical protein QOZ80_2AG0130480 [Eleusine coracana subsp. coracana]